MRAPPGPYRLHQGGHIDRRRTVAFSFNGRAYRGYAGDSVASALLGEGVRTVARSFKFHRPRGILTCGSEEPNALIQLGEGARTVPAVRAPVAELMDGLTARSLSGWPSLKFDVGRVLDFTAPMWLAGFYNKTFIWPSWHMYEPIIRKLAGLGIAPSEADPDRYETGNLHCDMLVVGGGIAGLEAALSEARSGTRVVLVEQDRTLGGAALWDANDVSISSRVSTVVKELCELPRVRLMTRTTATGFYDHQVVTLLERSAPDERRVRERFLIVRAPKVVLATGAIEQPLIFANNDRPGIVLAEAARQYLHRYGVGVGRKVLIATNNDSAYLLAADLQNAGVEVVGIADSRRDVSTPLRTDMQHLQIPHFAGWFPIDTDGFSALKRVTLGRLSGDARTVGTTQEVPCDALAVSGGFNPALSLFAQAGGRLVFDPCSGALRPQATPEAVVIAGFASDAVPIGPRVSPVGDPKRQWIDLLHDVTVADLALALRENFTEVEHVKRYTTVGMAADQGKTTAPATLEILGRLRGVASESLGHTTLRPPVTPVTLGAIAGRELRERFSPHRRLPLHDWHVSHGALMQEFGEWRRPVVYLKTGERREKAVHREALRVRTGAGIFDGSSLGKIEVHGPDALTFLDRFYINDLTTLKPYRARYGLMCRETGTLFDDGTVVMLARDRCLITTTSGNASRVTQWLEEWHQCEWPQLNLAIVPVTESWATLSLTGPQSRSILSKLPGDIDLSPTAFAHLSMREGRVLGIPARIYRVSFTGELTYEINVPSDQASVLWDALLAVGGDPPEPFGLDALMLLRLEKGFLHLGSDTDGTTVPADVGWGGVAAKKSGDFIGKRSLQLPEYRRPDRLQLVGLTGENGNPLVIGSHLRVQNSKDATDGWVTSAGLSVERQEPIGMAMVRKGRSRIGESVTLYVDGAPMGHARVVHLPFYDPTGDRMNG
jgi:sarcosine oxidase subunit alpha